MDLILDKLIKKPAYSIAVSHDGKRVAISGERKVYVYEIATWEKIIEIKISNVSCMHFLEDNNSIIILNTTGNFFVWDGNEIKFQKKIPESKRTWEIFYYISDELILVPHTGSGVLWYNVKTNQLSQFYTTHQWITKIGDVSNGKIRLLSGDVEVKEQCFELVTLDYEGNVLSKVLTESMATDSFSEPLFIKENMFALSTLKSNRNILSWMSGRCGDLYFINTEGKVLRQITMNSEPKLLHMGNMLVTYQSGIRQGVDFCNLETMKIENRLEERFFEEVEKPNPVSEIKMLDEKHILIGTWGALYVFRIEE